MNFSTHPRQYIYRKNKLFFFLDYTTDKFRSCNLWVALEELHILLASGDRPNKSLQRQKSLTAALSYFIRNSIYFYFRF